MEVIGINNVNIMLLMQIRDMADQNARFLCSDFVLDHTLAPRQQYALEKCDLMTVRIMRRHRKQQYHVAEGRV